MTTTTLRITNAHDSLDLVVALLALGDNPPVRAELGGAELNEPSLAFLVDDLEQRGWEVTHRDGRRIIAGRDNVLWPLFARKSPDDDAYQLLFSDGSPVRRLNIDGVWPLGSPLGARYEHPEGLRLDLTQLAHLRNLGAGVDLED